MKRAATRPGLRAPRHTTRIAHGVAVAILLTLALPGAAPAQPITSDSRIKTFVYNPNEVFSITTHYGYQSNIEFALKENIETISVGDRVAWQVIPAGRRLFIRALEENARTNMTVVTNQRAYQFELRSSASNAVVGSEALTYVVRFFYPTDAAATAGLGMTPPPVLPSVPAPASAAPNQPPAPQAAAIVSTPLPPETAPAPITLTAPKPVAPQAASQALPPASPPEKLAFAAEPPAPAPTPPTNPAKKSPVKPAPTEMAMPQPKQMPLAPIPNLAPLEPAPPVRPAMAAAQPPLAAPASINYRYTFSGPNDLAPLKIYDDGRTTYLKLPGTALPRVTAEHKTAGWMDIAPRRTPEGLVAVDTVAKSLRLKQANGEVVVFNEAGAEVK